MSLFRHSLNGQTVTDPDGWDSFTEELLRDFDRRLFYLEQPLTLTFAADGYEILRTEYLAGYCNEVEYVAEQQCDQGWRTVTRGVVKLSDITWDRIRCTAECSITDNGAAARILDNSKVAYYPTANLFKDGDSASPVTPVILEMKGSDCNYIKDVVAFDILDVYRGLVRFITGGSVTVVSDWYNDLPGTNRFAITSGAAIHGGSGTDTIAPKVTFDDLHRFLCRAFNLMGAITTDPQTGATTIRLEPEEYWRGAVAVALDDVGELSQEIDPDQLYAAVEFGTLNAVKNENGTQNVPLGYVPLNTFFDESYFVKGTCNTDRTLNLRLPYVCCTNAITRLALQTNEDNLDAVVVLEYDRSTLEVTVDEYFIPNVCLYNPSLRNSEVAARYRFPLDLGQYIEPQTAEFDAAMNFSLTPAVGIIALSPSPTFTDYGPFNTLQFTDVDDPNNVWDDSTAQRYTAPASGWFVFQQTVPWGVYQTVGTGVVQFGIRWQRYDSIGNPVGAAFDTWSLPLLFGSDDVNASLNVTWGTALNATDYVEARQVYRIRRTTVAFGAQCEVRIYAGGTMACTFASIAGGVLPNADPNFAAVVKSSTEWFTTPSEWADLRNDHRSAIRIGAENIQPFSAWRSRIERNVSTGATTFEVLSPWP